MEPELIYRAPEAMTDREVIDALNGTDLDTIRRIPINVGFNHENWKFIQDICVRLSDHADTYVRANALLGLSYAARFRGRVEKNIVKPILLRGLKDSDPHVVGTAQDAIIDINRLMGWRIGGAKRQKELEKRYEKRG